MSEAEAAYEKGLQDGYFGELDTAYWMRAGYGAEYKAGVDKGRERRGQGLHWSGEPLPDRR